MGGSLARALKTLPDAPRISGLSLSTEDLNAALDAAALDKGYKVPADFLAGLDLVVFCTPLRATLEFLRTHRQLISPEAILTDVVSLKEPVLEEAQVQGLGPVFVGGHPMAGGEATGFGAGRADLYRGARTWIVPGKADEGAVSQVEGLWSLLGAKTERIGAREHDELMALVSHLPQLLSSALGAVLSDAGVERSLLGPGGRDMTRLAGSDQEMWLDLLRSAPEVLQDAVRAVEGRLSGIRRNLEEGQVEELLEMWDTNRTWFGEKR